MRIFCWKKCCYILTVKSELQNEQVFQHRLLTSGTPFEICNQSITTFVAFVVVGIKTYCMYHRGNWNLGHRFFEVYSLQFCLSMIVSWRLETDGCENRFLWKLTCCSFSRPPKTQKLPFNAAEQPYPTFVPSPNSKLIS